MNSKDIIVSVFVLTYNQENYIEQTLLSILNQKTNFEFEIVIGEDHSTDNTLKIIRSYQKRYQNIKVITSNENVGLINNFNRTIKNCRGKFIAICDGDDFWIDDFKLQKQVDFLEENKNYKIVGSNLNYLYKDGTLKRAVKNKVGLTYTFKDLIFRNLVPSVTAMFYNTQFIEPLPKWILKYPYGDWITYLWTIKDEGLVYLLEDITAVYRVDVGVSYKIRKTPSQISQVNLEIVNDIFNDSNFGSKKEDIFKSLLEHKLSLMACFNRERKYFSAIKEFYWIFLRTNFKIKYLKFYFYSLRKSLL